ELEQRREVVERRRAIVVVDGLLIEVEAHALGRHTVVRPRRLVVPGGPQVRLHALALLSEAVGRLEHEHVAADRRLDDMREAAVRTDRYGLAVDLQLGDVAGPRRDGAGHVDAAFAALALHGRRTRRILDLDLRPALVRDHLLTGLFADPVAPADRLHAAE